MPLQRPQQRPRTARSSPVQVRQPRLPRHLHRSQRSGPDLHSASPSRLGPISTVPYQPKVPASSNCVTYTSSALYASLPTVQWRLDVLVSHLSSPSGTRTSSAGPSNTAAGNSGNNGSAKSQARIRHPHCGCRCRRRRPRRPRFGISSGKKFPATPYFENVVTNTWTYVSPRLVFSDRPEEPGLASTTTGSPIFSFSDPPTPIVFLSPPIFTSFNFSDQRLFHYTIYIRSFGHGTHCLLAWTQSTYHSSRISTSCSQWHYSCRIRTNDRTKCSRARLCCKHHLVQFSFSQSVLCIWGIPPLTCS
jgi:hypothetical protein